MNILYNDYIISKINYYLSRNNDIKYIMNEDNLINDIINIVLFSIEFLYYYIINNNDIILELIYDDIDTELFNINHENLYENFIANSFINNLYNINNELCEEIILVCNKVSLDMFYKYIMPKRSYKKTYITDISNKEKLKNTIQNLKLVKQPDQRTDEWYTFRNSVLTASNIYKIFQSQSSQSQLIIEKSEPLDLTKFQNINILSPMHWGQKYEPVSIMYYEWLNKTKVDEFGCIQHTEYRFLAASPDGIICDPSSTIFGRMLEIKNVVSREINGIPKMEYWIQMQLQMEVCNLNECDFLETKFIEYQDENEFISDNNSNKYKGIIAHFIIENKPYYEYSCFNLNEPQLIEWTNLIMDNEKQDNKELVRFIYWKLEKISLVLVLRNKLWFSSVLPYINNFWDILCSERENGTYKLRKKEKFKKTKLNPVHELGNLCLINL